MSDIQASTYNHVVEYLYTGYTCYVRLISLFTMLTLLLSSLAMLAMSTYYAKQHTRNVAIHKVMGCANGVVYVRMVKTFMWSILIAAVVAMPCAWLVAERWLEGYEYRIENSVWYYLLTALVVMLVGVIAISWQAVRLMRTNPVEALR